MSTKQPEPGERCHLAIVALIAWLAAWSAACITLSSLGYCHG